MLGGDVQNAIKSHMTCKYFLLSSADLFDNPCFGTDWNIWRRHSGLPEVWDAHFLQATSFQYPLRPEFVESTWYLYRVGLSSISHTVAHHRTGHSRPILSECWRTYFERPNRPRQGGLWVDWYPGFTDQCQR